MHDDLPIDLETAGVADVQHAMDAGTLTAERLVLAYLDRIARYDHWCMPSGASLPMRSTRLGPWTPSGRRPARAARCTVSRCW